LKKGLLLVAKIEIDIHGMTVADAKLKLERLIATLAMNVKEIDVIHGYNQGDALQNMIRKGLKSKRIKQRILSLNNGITTLIIE